MRRRLRARQRRIEGNGTAVPAAQFLDVAYHVAIGHGAAVVLAGADTDRDRRAQPKQPDRGVGLVL